MTRRKYYRVLNKYSLVTIDHEGMHAIGPRGSHFLFLRTRWAAKRVWYCCQCQGRIDYGERLWRSTVETNADRICESCASLVPGYRQEGITAAERNRPSRYALEHFPLVAHAYRELDLANLFDDDTDLGACILKMIEILARADLSDPRAFDLVLKSFWDLAHKRPITGLTNHVTEWQDISKAAGRPLWRNIRDPDAYSTDGGTTFYRTDRPERRLATRTPLQRS